MRAPSPWLSTRSATEWLSASLKNLQNGSDFGMAESESGSGVFDESFSGDFHFLLDTDQGDESGYSTLSISAGDFEVDTWDDGEGYAQLSAESAAVAVVSIDDADLFLSEMVNAGSLADNIPLRLRWPLSKSCDSLSFSGAPLSEGRTIKLEINAVPEPSTFALLALGPLAFAYTVRKKRRAAQKAS